VEDVEKTIAVDLPEALSPPEGKLRIHRRGRTTWRDIWHAMAYRHRRRSILGFTLMVTQAFFYNAVLFTFGLVLMRYYGVPARRLGVYLVPLALGNFLGPVLLGHLFDRIGRKRMIAGTYIGAGCLMALTSWLFRQDTLTLFTQCVSWSVVFLVASSAASSAYLTVSEIFLSTAARHEDGQPQDGAATAAMLRSTPRTFSRAAGLTRCCVKPASRDMNRALSWP
jgi:MFS family permease